MSTLPSKGNVLTVSYNYNEPEIGGALIDFESHYIRVSAGEIVFDVEEMIKPLVAGSARKIKRFSPIVYDGDVYAVTWGTLARVRVNEILRERWSARVGASERIYNSTDLEIPIPPVDCEQMTLRAINCRTDHGLKLILEGVSVDDFKTSEIEVLYENNVAGAEFSLELSLDKYLDLRDRYSLSIRIKNMGSGRWDQVYGTSVGLTFPFAFIIK